ncbi:MAG TPA: glycerol-3-phosphate acyltransferase [Bacillota bacterium]|nr:glycerol-3-phosphate acyltransferase [Bacillota bacterium]HOK69353.1 glycerol-3-phosphate acyltransferase [Bacillota bacterium]HPP85215.1 glycerol-3-phosphate acyltransferase [Bacillota bacterium]
MFGEKFTQWILMIGFGYLLGSCLFCAWIPWLIHKKDIVQESDDGNPGTANVFKLCGWRLGFLCLALDLAKGFLPVFIGINKADINYYLFTLVMLAPVCGHAWSVFSHFQGGKCIATIFGEMIALLRISPVGLILCGLYILFSTAVRITPNSRRSILVFSLFAVLSFSFELYTGRFFIGLGCLLVSVVAIIKHLPSMQRKPAEENGEDAVAKAAAD